MGKATRATEVSRLISNWVYTKTSVMDSINTEQNEKQQQ
jgi:hypothetical protein